MKSYYIKQVCGLFTALLVFIVSGCSSDEALKQYNVEEEFSEGMRKYQQGDYLEAIDNFKIVTLQFQGSRYADAAQFYMGECRFMREEYVLAAYEYEQLLKLMPHSPYCSKALFQQATSYYKLSPSSYLDQEYTRKAIDTYQAFLEYYPTDSLATIAEERIKELNTKLAKKEYENGIIYMKMKYYRSAAYYFDIILNKYHDTPYAEPALLKKAEALYHRKKYDEAEEALKKFLERYPMSTAIGEARKLAENIKAGIAAALEEAKKPKKIQQIEKEQGMQEGS
ncbi:MAG: outer membrane protein assembly factor BamD [Bacteroidetes bacterium]|nr:outer membrane protein assembly factor BamD [Bacteroidota bacterium]